MRYLGALHFKIERNLSFTITQLLFVVLILLLEVWNSNAKEVNRDSLKTILANSTVDSITINVLEELAVTGEYGDRLEAIGYYSRLLEFNIDVVRRGEILNRMGYFNWQLGNFDTSIKYFKQALTIFEELNDSAFIGRIYNNIATSNWGLGDNINALNNYQTSLNYRKKIGDTNGVSKVLNNIGKLYQDIGLYNEAFKMHNEALGYANKINNANSIAYTFANIGNCYEHFNEIEKALETYEKGYNILTTSDKDNRSNSYFTTFIGGVYLKMNQPDSALYYNKMSIKYAKYINNKHRIASAENKLGINYLKINELDSAHFYINSSYNTSLEKGYTVLIKDNLFALADLAEKEGKINTAFHYYKQASVLNDSLYNQELVSKITDVQFKYTNEQKEREYLLLRKNNDIQEITIRQQKALTWYLIIGVVFALIVLLFISKSLASNKRLNKKLEVSEKNLINANADKDKFFTIIAHDLRTPFNGLLGITELLESDYDKMPNKEKKELISLLRKSSLNLYSLLDSLLQWARTQIGNMEYNFKTFDFYKNALNITETLGPVATAKNISVRNNIQPNTLVFADEISTLTVLRNLVSNAIKFTHAGGTITISCQEKDSELILLVSDNGVGMRKDKIGKLFMINERVTQPGTDDELGTGLGLILCKEFIEKNNGTIWVESETGKGSTFSFSLPAKKI